MLLLLLWLRCKIVDLWWARDDIPTLLVMMLHFSTTHLLLKLFLEEVDFKLKFLLDLFALSLFFSAQICLLFQLFFVLSLQRPYLIFFASDLFAHKLLLFDSQLGIFLCLLWSVFSQEHCSFRLLNLVFKIDTFLLPFRQNSFDFLLNWTLFVLDLLTYFFKLLDSFLIGSFEVSFWRSCSFPS